MDSAYPSDLQAVLNLLQKLSQVDDAYPLDLFLQRRVEFLDNALTVKTFLPHGNAGHGGGSLAASSVKNVLVNSLLTIVLVAEIAVSAYVFRDQWLPLLNNDSPAQVNTAPEAFEITDPILPSEETATDLPVETALPEGTAVPTATPAPESTSVSIPGDVDVPSDSSANAPANISSSSVPPSEPTSDPLSEPVEPVETEKEHPGLHLGQTPGPPNPPGQNKTP